MADEDAGAPPITPDVWERKAFEKRLLSVLPDLRAYARFVTGNPTEADDLTQDTVIRALSAYRSFDIDTNIKAWLFHIFRNLRINKFRRRRLETVDDAALETLWVPASQEDHLEVKAVLRALQRIAPQHREVITLIRAGGLSYEDAAAIMGCALGTVKSRLSRADAALRSALGPDVRAPRPRARSEHPSQNTEIQKFA